MQDLSRIDRKRNGPESEEQGAAGEGKQAEEPDPVFVARGIDQSASGNLACHGRQRADAERGADLRLRPAFGGQIDSDEGPEAGLNVREEKREPVEPTRTGAQGGRARRGVRRSDRAVRAALKATG